MNIENYLVLSKYFLSLFGTGDFKDLQQKLKDEPVGYDSDGRSYFFYPLRSMAMNRIPEEVLLKYDENILEYVHRINYHREDKINLKYFQYLAVLVTEIFLDNLKNRKPEFLAELNEFLAKYRQDNGIEIPEDFSEPDLNKLAFWMATGSGKTLIMNINYHQFFRYKPFSPDNILLITPNERLSKQHFDELEKNGIPCRLYGGSASGLFSESKDEVLVIEITKFVTEKTGGGVRLPLDAFEGKNLIFVDEGHKGQRSEEQAWKKSRDKLSENGFSFEYSATFREILSEQNKEILSEYARSIHFNYSYKYFYLDGYGKDFLVLNIKKPEIINKKEFQEILFIANLLSFYEQLLIYEEQKEQAKEHNIEKPLWIFVGTTVSGKEEPDVIQIVEFFKRVTSETDWVKSIANKILSSGIKDENGQDLFKDRFEHLKTYGLNTNDIYTRVFGGKGKFEVYEIKGSEGELGLRVGENDYCGVINIGDVSGFKKKLEEKGIEAKKDPISASLFDTIKTDNSRINILIGSKKFIEGWDTWRVSSMGLLHIGQSQGPQIIQLFGRGIRLKGKDSSLKRSEEKSIIRNLQTLNIYGIEADYLEKFINTIGREVDFEFIDIPVKPQCEEKWNELFTLSKKEGLRYDEAEVLPVAFDDKANNKVTIDLLPRLTIYKGVERKETGPDSQEVKVGTTETTIPQVVLDLMDWGRIMPEIYDFKITRKYWNLVFNKEDLKNILNSERYTLRTSSELAVKTVDDLKSIEDIAILIIKKYLDRYYHQKHKRFEMENMKYGKLGEGEQLPLFAFDKGNKNYAYTVQIEKSKTELIEEIKKLANDLNKLIKESNETLPRVYFDHHLYVPILLHSKDIDKISPAGLVDSEKNFIEGLRKYLEKHPEITRDRELYLLRNFPKTGVGFFILHSFYPDFIMWLKSAKGQKIVFLDPKGMVYSNDLDNEKVKLAEKIKEIEKGLKRPDIQLESFILSDTKWEDLEKGKVNQHQKPEYIKHHVLFLKDNDWQDHLFQQLQ